MNSDRAHIVRVRLKYVHPLKSVVIENSDAHIVGAGHHPIFAWNEFTRAHWDVAYLKRLDKCLVLVVP